MWRRRAISFRGAVGGRWTVSVTEKRTMVDWANFIKNLVDRVYPNAEKITFVLDNLNTYKIPSLYEAFPAEEARRIASKIELGFSPKYGSWLNIVEIGLSVLKRQCIPPRIGTFDQLRKAMEPYVAMKNAERRNIDWQFKTEDTHIKLKKLDPKL